MNDSLRALQGEEKGRIISFILNLTHQVHAPLSTDTKTKSASKHYKLLSIYLESLKA